VLTPWLGQNRVSVQITATLEDSETRQTVERVRNTMVGGQARPSETTVLTTRVPEGRIQRLNAIVILGFDATAAEIKRAGELTRQALGLVAVRGDSVNVYALPGTAAAVPAGAAPAVAIRPPAPVSIPQVRLQRVPSAQINPFPALPLVWLAAGAGGVLLLGAIGWWRMRRPQAVELALDDFEVEIDTARNQALQDPRVTADVIKLWMRA